MRISQLYILKYLTLTKRTNSYVLLKISHIYLEISQPSWKEYSSPLENISVLHENILLNISRGLWHSCWQWNLTKTKCYLCTGSNVIFTVWSCILLNLIGYHLLFWLCKITVIMMSTGWMHCLLSKIVEKDVFIIAVLINVGIEEWENQYLLHYIVLLSVSQRYEWGNEKINIYCSRVKNARVEDFF